VKASDFWQAPVGDCKCCNKRALYRLLILIAFVDYRMPLCSYFDGNGEGPGGEED
jgi:hypothetical protein